MPVSGISKILGRILTLSNAVAVDGLRHLHHRRQRLSAMPRPFLSLLHHFFLFTDLDSLLLYDSECFGTLHLVLLRYYLQIVTVVTTWIGSGVPSCGRSPLW